MVNHKPLFLLLAISLCTDAWADEQGACLERALEQAKDTATLGEIRRQCLQDPDSYRGKAEQARQASGPSPEAKTTEKAPDDSIDVKQKRELEFLAAENPYGISPHRRNYMMPLTYSRRPNGAPLGLADSALDQAEVKFQFSYKVPLMKEILDQPIDLHFAYTNQSYWQAFNGANSRPFRETNHEPELFFTWTDPWLPPYAEHGQYRVGLSHHSNGRSGDLSRSWNRIFVSTLLQHRHYYLGLKVWDRIEDDPKEFPGDPRGDDNPDIEKFMGHFELEISRVKEKRTVSVMLRNNLRRDENKGALRVSYSFPLSDSLRGYMEYFEGYGESLIDYNHDNQRFGVGIAISDWP